jgi:hypothetical protein
VTTEEIFDVVLEEHPIDPSLLASGVDALQECIVACTVCADACVAEPDVAAMAECIRRDHDCIAVCRAAVEVISRWPADDASLTVLVLEAAERAAARCADECGRHEHDHCRECAERARRAESACRALIDEANRAARLGM